MKNPVRQLMDFLKKDENVHSGLWYTLRDMETKDLIRFNKRTQEYNKREGSRLFFTWLVWMGLSVGLICVLAFMTESLDDPETESFVLCFLCLTGGLLMGGLLVMNNMSAMATEVIKERLDKDMEEYFKK